METSILDEPWFHEPFKWYESTTDKYVLSIQITPNKALDVLAGLYDIYKGFERNDKKQAIADLNALAILLIAHSMGLGDEAIEEILVYDANQKMDEGLSKLMEGEENNG